MADPAPDQRVTNDEGEISLLALATVLLRWRRAIIALAAIGMAFGIASGLTSTRVYKAEAIFIPQGSEGSGGSLALAASQLGMRMSSGGDGWRPEVYVALLQSRALLEPMALDTIAVAEQQGRRVPISRLLGIEGPLGVETRDLAVRGLRSWISASVIRELSAVQVSVTTPWPSVSLALTERVVRGVNEFNVRTRKSQAKAEREFVEEQAVDAERALRYAEDRLQVFLQRNRELGGASNLAVERDRMQREVTLRQELHTSWLKSREEARIREVRDTPVITVFEEPTLPITGQPRGTVSKGITYALIGGIIGVLMAVFSHGMGAARTATSGEAREFFRIVDEATPRFLRKARR